MKKNQIMRVTGLLLVLAITACLTSCKLGRAVNELNDACPITLDEGIIVTGADADKRGVTISVKINTDYLDYVPSSTSPEWKSAVTSLKSLMNTNPYCAEVLKQAKDQRCTVKIYSFDGSLLHDSSTLTIPVSPYSSM